MNKLRVILCCMALALLCACKPSLGLQEAKMGAIRLCLADISIDAESKATPAALGKPEAQQFSVKITRNSNGTVLYQGPFTDQDIKATPDSYTVTAWCGENPTMAFDKPYYKGSTQVTVPEDASEAVVANIECSVANCLISVEFCRSQEEREKLEKYYSKASVAVISGSSTIEIAYNRQDRSVYMPAGTAFSLEFRGILKDSGVNVNMPLAGESIPTSLAAAEHLKLTIGLLPAASGLAIKIEKVEIEQVSIEETLPFEWLPLPAITASHVIGADGTLMGTQLVTDPAYPGCTWTASIKNASGTVVRELEGEGALTSQPSESAQWPYLPAGNYSASFSYTYNGKTVNIERERSFSIPAPQGIGIVPGYYTSYTKYADGDIAAANACAGTGIYDVTAELKLAAEISGNSNYSGILSLASVRFVIDGNTSGASSWALSGRKDKIEGLSWARHSGNLEVTFDGGKSKADFNFEISGIPYEISFRTYYNNDLVRSQGWTCNGNTGKAPTTEEFYTCQSGSKGFIVSPKFNTPDDINVTVDLLQKYYIASLGSSTMIVYVDAVPDTGTEAAGNEQGCESSNSTSANSGRQTNTFNFKIYPGRPYVALSNNGASAGIRSYYYIHNFKIQYKQ